MLVNIICSRILQHIDVSDMGLYDTTNNCDELVHVNLLQCPVYHHSRHLTSPIKCR